jgi:hypothetical protein
MELCENRVTFMVKLGFKLSGLRGLEQPQLEFCENRVTFMVKIGFKLSASRGLEQPQPEIFSKLGLHLWEK